MLDLGPLLLVLVAAAAGAAVALLAARTRSRDLAEALRRASAAATAEREATAGERDRLRMLVRELADGVLIADANDRVSIANPAAERLLGTRSLAGRPLVEVIRDHEVLAAIRDARTGGEGTAEVERLDPPRYLRAVARAVPGGEIVIAVQDLTPLRRVEVVRRDFVANVSHELRTPLASLKALIEALESGALEDATTARDFVGRMHREIDDMTQLVAELLALARAESGTLDLRVEPVSPRDLLERSLSRLRPLAERAGLELTFSAAEELPAVRADPERVDQVLANLVHNSVKFTPERGTVTLSAQPDDGAVRFAVRDTGSGIDGAELSRVFERFYKADPGRAREGTGLGLAIAKHIVEAHGGRIWAESEGPGRGTTVSFTLPVAPAAGAGARSAIVAQRQ